MQRYTAMRALHSSQYRLHFQFRLYKGSSALHITGSECCNWKPYDVSERYDHSQCKPLDPRTALLGETGC